MDRDPEDTPRDYQGGVEEGERPNIAVMSLLILRVAGFVVYRSYRYPDRPAEGRHRR